MKLRNHILGFGRPTFCRTCHLFTARCYAGRGYFHCVHDFTDTDTDIAIRPILMLTPDCMKMNH